MTCLCLLGVPPWLSCRVVGLLGVAGFEDTVGVAALFETGHAIGLKTTAGAEVLIHIGIDTVMLKGKGFNVKVAQGDLVKAGQTLIEFDLDGIKEAGYDPTVMTVVTDKHDVDIKLPSVE